MWRNKLNSRMGTVVALVAMFVCSAVAVAGKPGGGGGTTANYNLVRLAYPGAISTEALQLNDSANVAGTYRDADNVPCGFHYDLASGAYTSLGVMTSARGINQQDAIVGQDELVGCGLYWDAPTSEPIVLPPLLPHTHSKAVAVNDARIIIGESYTPSTTFGNNTLVAWYVRADDSVMGPVPLPFLAGDIAGRVANLTEETVAGVTLVVGTSSTVVDSTEYPQPVSWTVTRTDSGLTVTGPAVFAGSYFVADAYGVNNLGDAVGMAAIQEGSAASPFQRLAGQPLGSLPLLSTTATGYATSINDAGQVVGQQVSYPRGKGAEFRAVLWTNSTTVLDLNSQVSLSRGETLDRAADINHHAPRGDILARINGNTPCLLIAK